MFLLGAYRLLYILNWVYRAYHEQHYHHDYMVYVAGTVQTLLYADFFYYYAIRYITLRSVVFSAVCAIYVEAGDFGLTSVLMGA